MTQPFKVVIPARYASTRLPGKPLLPIAGKPMIAHVCEKAGQAGADEVVVATDDERILSVVNALGIKAVMTRRDHQSGIERIAEVAELYGWAGDEIIVNVQGDEPLIPPELISGLAHTLSSQQQAAIATLAAVINNQAEIFNPNAVKVVLNKDSNALYFSRAPIPWDRDSFGKNNQIPSGLMPYYRHIGMYCYTVDFLKGYCAWQPSVLEKVEALEQLRILWYGQAIKVNIIDNAPPAGVDTEDDLLRVEKLLANNRSSPSTNSERTAID